jgi:hypothetical protein
MARRDSRKNFLVDEQDRPLDDLKTGRDNNNSLMIKPVSESPVIWLRT